MSGTGRVFGRLSCSDQMEFAKIVKAGYETTVTPIPFNIIEHFVNYIAPDDGPEEGKTSLQW